MMPCKNNKRYFLREARTPRSEDIKNVDIYTLNFPGREGEGTYFHSTLRAAEELIKLGKTESTNPKVVASNIFSAAMACEDRADRNRDYRKSAYKDNNGETINWEFPIPSNLSPENYEIYMRNKPWAKSHTEIEIPENLKKAQTILNDEKYFRSFKQVKEETGFFWPMWTAKAIFLKKGIVEIPWDMKKVYNTINYRNIHWHNDYTGNALLYLEAIYKFQKNGYLPWMPIENKR